MQKVGMYALIVALFLLGFMISSSYALDGWQYYREITIDNTQNSNTLTDYQVLVTIDTASLISAGKMRSDCGDIRFTESDGTTELSYWIEDGTCNTANTRIWVKVPSIPGSSSYTIQMWYGNSGAESESNGDNVFLGFEDFRDMSEWKAAKGSISTEYVDTIKKYALKITSSNTDNGQIFIVKNIGSVSNVVIEYLMYADTSSEDDYPNRAVLINSPDENTANRCGQGISIQVDSKVEIYDKLDCEGGVYGSDSNIKIPKDSWVHIKEVITPDSVKLKWWYLSSNEPTSWNYEYTHTFYSPPGTYLKIERTDRPISGTDYFSMVLVRKYTSPEPTTSVGEEQFNQQDYPPSISITSPEDKTYYGIFEQTFTFSVVDYDNETIKVTAYLDGNVIYSNDNYVNNTETTLTLPIGAGTHNFTVESDDEVLVAYESVSFYVWYGANITANTNTFDITININGINTTYSDVSYKEIEWTEVGNNSYADIWVTQEGYDMDYTRVYFNDTMGVVNVQMTIYTVHTFYMYDTKNNEYIKSFNLLVKNTQLEKQYSTTTGVIKVSTREIPDGVYALNATAFGYNYVELNMNLNNSYVINYTFETQPVNFIIRVFDEKTGNAVFSSLTLYLSDSVLEYTNERKYITSSGMTNPHYAVDGDLNTYASASDDFEAYYNISLGSFGVKRICFKSGTGQYGAFYYYVYNYNTASWDLLLYFYGSSGIRIDCFTINRSVIGSTWAYIKVTGNDEIQLFEIYQEDAPTKTYVFETPSFTDEQVEVSLKGENYPARRYYVTLTPYSSVTLNAYLLDKSYGFYFTPLVLEKNTNQPIEGALVTFAKYIGDSYKTIAQAKSNADGSFSIFIEPGITYKVAVIKDGYIASYNEYTPSTAIPSPVFYLTKISQILVNFTSLFADINYRLLPLSNILVDVGDYNATAVVKLSIYSYNGSLEKYGLEVLCNGTIPLYSKNVTTSPAGGEIVTLVNVTTCDNLTLITYIDQAAYDLITLKRVVRVIKRYKQGLEEAFRELKASYSEEEILILVIVSLVIVASLLSLVNPILAPLGVVGVSAVYAYFEIISTSMFVLMMLITIAVLFIMNRVRI